MYSLQVSCTTAEAEWLAAELWEFGTVAISEKELGERVVLLAGFAGDGARDQLLARFADYEPEWTQDHTDWELETREAWPPRQIGRRLFLAPTWCQEATPPGRVRLIHNPGAASGTGEHPCTQLALAALEDLVSSTTRVVDVGTGSGLLAMAALRFGAVEAVALDTDGECLATAQENFALNALTPWLVNGSASCLADGYADVTIANISGTVLLSILDDLVRITQSAGTLVLTGFTVGEAPVFQNVFPQAKKTDCCEWCCLLISLSSNA